MDARLLVIDDEPDLRSLYELTLRRAGYQVESAASLGEARRVLATPGERFDTVITDMRLPDGMGLELVKELAESDPTQRCIVITAYGSAESAVEALKAGAFDYLGKPVDLKQFRAVVASAVAQSRQGVPLSVQQAPGRLPAASAKPGPSIDIALDEPAPAPLDRQSQVLARLVGQSAPMLDLRQRIAKVAKSMAPILIRGESGTGKELAAKAIHGCSHRSQGPFVAVNCSAIPENLLEAEFFGARKGSYTGATHDREGFFQAAAGGTLFLDEIGDLPLSMQAKLLRAIQERSVRALGATQEEPVDVRIVSATHKDLTAEVHAGRFRQDLYYRLNVIELVLPPLRERRDDLPLLCHNLLARIVQGSGQPAPEVSPEFLRYVQNHPLQGNVRELENLLHRALALSDGRALEPPAEAVAPVGDPTRVAPVPAPPAHAAPPAAVTCSLQQVGPDLQAWLDRQERAALMAALNATGFNRTAAAAKLGLNLRQIRYRMSRLNITAPGENPPGQGLA